MDATLNRKIMDATIKKTNKSDANWNAKWERDDKVNTRSIANLVTDGFSEREKEKSPQEPVPIKLASRWRLLDEKSEVWVPLEKILIARPLKFYYFCFMTCILYWKHSLWRDLYPRYYNKVWSLNRRLFLVRGWYSISWRYSRNLRILDCFCHSLFWESLKNTFPRMLNYHYRNLLKPK